MDPLIRAVTQLFKKRMGGGTHFDLVPGQIPLPELLGWHGYAFRLEKERRLVVSLFCEPGFNIGILQHLLPQVLRDKMEVVRAPKFQQLPSGRNRGLVKPLRPGNLVFAGSGEGRRDLIGTITGFLKFGSERGKKRVWLLSCKHILTAQGRPNVEIRGAGGLLIGRKVVYSRGDQPDAAAVEVIHPHGIDSTYSSKLGLKSVIPIRQLAPGTLVKKEGNATGITCGLVVWGYAATSVRNIDGSREVLHCNDIIVASIEGQRRFVARGDSGALVVANGMPAGIVHSKMHEVGGISHVPGARGPFGLASHFDLAIRSIETHIRQLDPRIDPADHLQLLPLASQP